MNINTVRIRGVLRASECKKAREIAAAVSCAFDEKI